MQRVILAAQINLHLKNIKTLADLQLLEIERLEAANNAFRLFDKQAEKDKVEEICNEN